MTIYSIPEIASMGLITDVDTVESSIQAFTAAVNVRFEDGKIERGPVFSTYAPGGTADVRALIGYTDSNAVDHVVMMDATATIHEVAPNGKSATTVAPTNGFTPNNIPNTVTVTTLNDVVYFNRPDQSPFYRDMTSSGNFDFLSNYNSGWTDSEGSGAAANLPATVRFTSMRSYNSMLIGIGVRYGSTVAPNEVWWSDYAVNDRLPPINWAYQAATSQSGTNLLSEMNGNLVDGAKLGNMFLLLGTKETWLMQSNNTTTSIFTFSRLYDEGVISQNCYAEHDSRLYIFGDRDLYVTDGTSRQSIATGRVRKFVYSNISLTHKANSFVFHDPLNNEVLFCFTSTDQYCAFPAIEGNTGCNRAMVYNYNADTWYMYDLPYVTCASQINASNALTYADLTNANVTYAQLSGSYSGLQRGAANVVSMGSNASTVNGVTTAAALRTWAVYDEGVQPGTIDTWATAPCLLEKDGMDFGALTQVPGLQAKLRDVKLLSAIYVKGELDPNAAPVTFTVGTAYHGSDGPYWEASQTWTTLYSKLDFNVQARYISLQMTYNDYRSFRLDGLDLDIGVYGHRSR